MTKGGRDDRYYTAVGGASLKSTFWKSEPILKIRMWLGVSELGKNEDGFG